MDKPEIYYKFAAQIIFWFASGVSCVPAIAGEVRMCNSSSTNDLFVASVLYVPIADLLTRQYSWVGSGYEQVPAGRCSRIFLNAASNTSIWLRVVSNGRFVAGYQGDGGFGTGRFDSTDLRFCVNPSKNFSWARRNRKDAATDCADGSGEARFSFYLDVYRDIDFVIPVDPDLAVRTEQPDVVKMRMPAPRDNNPKLGDDRYFGFLFKYNEDLRRKARAAGVKTTGLNGRLMLLCNYGVSLDTKKGYVYWGEQLDREILVRLSQIEGSEELSELGIRSVSACPATENEALRIRDRNTVDWRNLR